MFLTVYSCLTIASTRYGIGRHRADVSNEDFVVANKLLWIGEAFAVLSIAISKSSFAVTLLHLAFYRWHHVLLWTVIVTVNMAMWMCFITIFAECTPVEKLWQTDVGGNCWDPHIPIYGSCPPVCVFVL